MHLQDGISSQKEDFIYFSRKMNFNIFNTGSMIIPGNEMFHGHEAFQWQAFYPDLGNGLTQWAMRCVLIQTEDFKLLIDCGAGNKISEKLRRAYGLENMDLSKLIKKEYALSPKDITHVLLSHLHFDHAGGICDENEKGELVSVFPNAEIIASAKQVEYAQNPHESDAESYDRRDVDYILRNKKLRLVHGDGEVLPGISVKNYHGHTPGQLVPYWKSRGKTFFFGVDLLPSLAHIQAGAIMAYDLDPELSFHEKNTFLGEVKNSETEILFQHDYYRGRMVLTE